jgi:hypothetical protein
MADPVKLHFEVGDDHLQLWERNDWRYAFRMGGRGNGRSGTASRFVVSQLPGTEYTRAAIGRAVKKDLRTSCWQELVDRLEEEEAREAFQITNNNMRMSTSGTCSVCGGRVAGLTATASAKRVPPRYAARALEDATASGGAAHLLR